MTSYRLLTANDLYKKYFSLGKEAASHLDLEQKYTLICDGIKYPDRKIDKSKGYGHVYAREEFFENHNLRAGDRLDFEINSSTNTINITITRQSSNAEITSLKKGPSITSSSNTNSSKTNALQPYKKISKNYCTMIIIPRNEFDRKRDTDALSYPGFYILLENNQSGYAGITNNPIERITTHKSESGDKKWWTHALVFLYHDEENDCHFDIADVSYIEHLALYNDLSTGTKLRFRHNKKKADKPYLKPLIEADLDQTFCDIKSLLSVFLSGKI